MPDLRDLLDHATEPHNRPAPSGPTARARARQRDRRQRTLLATAIASTLTLGGVGVLSLDPSPGDRLSGPVAADGQAQRCAAPSFEQEGSIASVVRLHQNLREMLPNALHRYEGSSGSGARVTDSVVLGRVDAVVPDRGFMETGQPGTAGRAGAKETAFEDPQADWRTLRISVSVDEVLAGPPLNSFYVYLPLLGSTSTGTDAKQVQCAYDSLDEVVVLTKANPDSPEFLGLSRQFPDRPFGVASVSESGALTFPFASAEPGRSSATFLGDLKTLDDLRRAARGAEQVIVQKD